MELKILTTEKNPFLKREELIVEIKSESTPSKTDIVKELGKDEKLVSVEKVNTSFGDKKFVADILVYDDLKARQEIEVIPKKVKKKMEEERKKAEEAKKKSEEEAKKKSEEEAKKKSEEVVVAETSEDSEDGETKEGATQGVPSGQGKESE